MQRRQQYLILLRSEKMPRLTEYDEIRGIYKLKVDCNQGENIQKLGRLEDRDEVLPFQDYKEEMQCKNCNYVFLDDYYCFCPRCGQRLKNGSDSFEHENKRE